MECTRFLVRPGHNDGWLIEDGRRDMGPYHSWRCAGPAGPPG